jgi:hypothetical protein
MFFLEPVTFCTELVNPIEHSLQERFSRGRRNARLLKLPNVPALTVNLEPHSFDLCPDMIKLHHVLARQWLFYLPENGRDRSAVAFEKPKLIP